MSVKTAQLAETIEQIEAQIEEAKGNENLVNELQVKRSELVKELSVANKPLSEGRQILKD